MQQKNIFDIESLMKELITSPKEKDEKLISASGTNVPSDNVKEEENKQAKNNTTRSKKPARRRPNTAASDTQYPIPISQPASDSNSRSNPTKKKSGNVFIVKKQKESGKATFVSGPGIQEKYITPNMDTPLSALGMREDILAALNRVSIYDVGDLCMIRKNGLERYHILNDADLSALCKFMGRLHVSLL